MRKILIAVLSLFVISTAQAATVKLLMVAGGGAGGALSNCDNASGGGGAGGMIYNAAYPVTAGNSYLVEVGTGGVGYVAVTYNGVNGKNSVFDSTWTYGGGGGGGWASPSGQDGVAGGSGGGAGASPASAGGTGVAGQGYAGGTSYGGGGGRGGVGANSGGAGGAGLTCDITGLTTYYAAGGSGYVDHTRANGIGGSCDSSASAKNATGGVQDTGSGGGARYDTTGTGAPLTGGSGANGIVIVAYKTDGSDGITTASTGGTVTTSGDYTIHTFKVADSGTYFVAAGASGGSKPSRIRRINMGGTME